MDWKVSEDTGLTQEIHLSANNISEQIRMGMAKEVLTEVSDDGESRAAYDREGLQQMRTLARNMAFLMKAIADRREKAGLPEREPSIYTNFVR